MRQSMSWASHSAWQTRIDSQELRLVELLVKPQTSPEEKRGKPHPPQISGKKTDSEWLTGLPKAFPPAVGRDHTDSKPDLLLLDLCFSHSKGPFLQERAKVKNEE